MIKKNSLFLNDKFILFVVFLFGVFSWLLYPKAFIWDDAYFHLVIARNLALFGEQTFSNVYSTNGFHPLFVYLLSAYSFIFSIFNSELISNPVFAVPLSALLLALGSINFWKIAAFLKLPKLLSVGIPLVYLLLFQVLYSEAHLHYAALSYLTLIAVNRTIFRPYGPYLMGFACALVCLSRLDSVFIVSCFILWYFNADRDVKNLLRIVCAFSIIILPYLLSNFFCFGSMVPISGWMKSSFPAVFVDKGLTCFSIMGYNVAGGLLPIAVSVIVLALIKKSPDMTRSLIYVYLGGSLLHFVYTGFFTRFWTLYWWYYVPHIILLSFAAAFFFKNRPFPHLLTSLVFFLIIPLFCSAVILMRWGNTNGDRHIQRSVTELLNYMDHEGISKKSILVSDVPGVIAYFTSNNLIAADMLTANRKFYDSMMSSEDALSFILDYCRHLGKPVEYYIYFGSKFIVHDKSGTSITYNDPKAYPKLNPIGKLKLGNTHVFSSSDNRCRLWKIED